MGAIFQCDWCGAQAENLTGWLLLHVSFQHWDPPAPGAPGNFEDGVKDLGFDKKQCRDNWLARAELEDPTTGTSPT